MKACDELFSNKFASTFVGTELFTKVMGSNMPCVFIGSPEGGILICKTILLENGFKMLDITNIEDIEQMVSSQNAKQRLVFVLDGTVDLSSYQVQMFLFYLLEIAKRGELLIAFILDSSIFIQSQIPPEIHSRLFELNIVHLRTPSLDDIETIIKNIDNTLHQNKLNPFEINRDYTKIANIIL